MSADLLTAHCPMLHDTWPSVAVICQGLRVACGLLSEDFFCIRRCVWKLNVSRKPTPS